MKLLQIISLLLLFISGAANADCENIVAQIDQDGTHYAENIRKMHLPWMQLGWLQHNLGAGQIANDDNVTKHEWQCPTNQRVYLIASTDNKGTISNVEGRFSSASGAHLFSICLKHCDEQSTAAAPPRPSVTKSDLCDRVAKGIYNVSAYYQNNNDEPIAIKHSTYPWESKAWLDQNLGPAAYTNMHRWEKYTWNCSANSSSNDNNAVYYYVYLNGNVIESSKYCDSKACYTSTVSRGYDQLTTAVTTQAN